MIKPKTAKKALKQRAERNWDAQADSQPDSREVWEFKVNTESATVHCSYNPNPAMLYFARLFAPILRLEKPGEENVAPVLVYKACLDYAKNLLRNTIEQALTDLLDEQVMYEVGAQALRELDGRVYHLNTRTTEMISAVALEAAKASKRRMNAPEAGRPLEKEAFIEDVKVAIQRLRERGKKVSQENVAEILRCDARAIRERQRNYGMTWREVIRLCG